MTYRAKHVTQWDGSALASANCRMASIATMLDTRTEGDKTSSGKAMRSHTDDQSGGTDAGDAKQSWARGYAEDIVIGDGGTWSSVKSHLAGGKGVTVDVWYASLSSDNRCQSSANFGHTIFLAPEPVNADGMVVSDPLCSGWHRVPESQVRAGAEEWGRRVMATMGTAGPGNGKSAWQKAARELMNEARPTGLERDDRPPAGAPEPGVSLSQPLDDDIEDDEDTGGAQPIGYTTYHPRALPPPPTRVVPDRVSLDDKTCNDTDPPKPQKLPKGVWTRTKWTGKDGGGNEYSAATKIVPPQGVCVTGVEYEIEGPPDADYAVRIVRRLEDGSEDAANGGGTAIHNDELVSKQGGHTRKVYTLPGHVWKGAEGQFLTFEIKPEASDMFLHEHVFHIDKIGGPS